MNYFKFIDFKKTQKIGLSTVVKTYTVSALLRNALTCLYLGPGLITNTNSSGAIRNRNLSRLLILIKLIVPHHNVCGPSSHELKVLVQTNQQRILKKK